jgi:hypothetical protein
MNNPRRRSNITARGDRSGSTCATPPSLFLLLTAMLLMGACTAARPSAPAHDLVQESGDPGQESPRTPTSPPGHDDVITGGTDPDAIELNGSDVGTSIYAVPPHPEEAFPATGSHDELCGGDPAGDILGSDCIEGSDSDELCGGVSDDVIEVNPKDIVPCPCLDAWLALPGNSDRIFADPTCNCPGSVFTEDDDDSKPAGE